MLLPAGRPTCGPWNAHVGPAACPSWPASQPSSSC